MPRVKEEPRGRLAALQEILAGGGQLLLDQAQTLRDGVQRRLVDVGRGLEGQIADVITALDRRLTQQLDDVVSGLAVSIRKEIDEIATGASDAHDNALHNAPHTVDVVTADAWPHPYSREKAAFPLPYLREGFKFWPTVSRIDQAFGDRNLVCVCPPVEAYMEV